MASTSTISMATLPAHLTHKQSPVLLSSFSFFNPLGLRLRASQVGPHMAARSSRPVVRVEASFKEKAVMGLTAAALTAYMVAPDVAEAAVSPSLKNFLLSIVAGGVVAVVIVGAVIAVANFDPVKRA